MSVFAYIAEKALAKNLLRDRLNGGPDAYMTLKRRGIGTAQRKEEITDIKKYKLSVAYVSCLHSWQKKNGCV